MNKKLIIFSLFFCSSAFAGDGIVIVLQAPLLKEPSSKSNVLQYLRKGERVYIPNELLKNGKKLPNFIPTFDRAGNAAFISSYYVKPITNDESEELTSVNYGEHDPTDYRLEEPIPNTYPFSNTSYLKASFALSLGNNIKSPYGYQSTLKDQDYSSEKGGRFVFLRRVSFDKYDRFYFGALLIFSSTTNYFEFTDQTSSTENRSMLRFGPYLTFDAYKGKDLRFTLGTGFTYNYHKTSIQRTGIKDSSEERFFSGFSVSPFISAYAQIENLFPAFDVIAGTELNFYLNRNLNATSEATLPELWPTNTLKEEMKPQANLYLGVQFKY